MKITPELLQQFYRTYGFPLEITTAEEQRLLQERESDSALAMCGVDEFDAIRAHGFGVSLS